MHTLVDGYNLIFGLGWVRQSQGSLALEKARRRLIHELSQRIDRQDRPGVTIVFDAKRLPVKLVESRKTVAGFEIVFAQGYEEADALIEELIQSHSSPRQLQVVSDDRRLKEAARRRKSIVLGCEQWLDLLEESCLRAKTDAGGDRLGTAREQEMESLETTDWLQEFGLDRAELESLEHESEGGGEYDNPFPLGYGEDLPDEA